MKNIFLMLIFACLLSSCKKQEKYLVGTCNKSGPVDFSDCKTECKPSKAANIYDTFEVNKEEKVVVHKMFANGVPTPFWGWIYGNCAIHDEKNWHCGSMLVNGSGSDHQNFFMIDGIYQHVDTGLAAMNTSCGIKLE